MKQLSILILILTAFLLSSNTGGNPESVDPIPEADITEVSEPEDLGLVYMHEEEKLARDVYISFNCAVTNECLKQYLFGLGYLSSESSILI